MEITEDTKAVRIFGAVWNFYDNLLKSIISLLIGSGIITWLHFLRSPELKLSDISTWDSSFSTSLIRLVPAYIAAVLLVVPITKGMAFVITKVLRQEVWENIPWGLSLVLRIILGALIILGYIATLMFVFQKFFLVTLLFIFPFIFCGLLYFMVVGVEGIAS